MERCFLCAGDVRPETGWIADSASYLDRLRGSTATIVGGSTAIDSVKPWLTWAIDESRLDLIGVIDDVKASTEAPIDATIDRCREQDAVVILGVGSGTAIDIRTGVVARLGREPSFVSVPTIPSTDGSSVCVVYTPDGEFAATCRRAVGPELILVDTDRLVESPPRFLRDGIGDAISTRFDVATIESEATTWAGGTPSYAAAVLADATYERM